MSNTHPEHDRPTGDGLTMAALLRLAADGELTPEERRIVDAHLREHPEDRARVAFEQSLRQRVATLMSRDVPDAAPLRESIVAAMRQESEAPAAPAPATRSDDGANEVIRRTDRSFWRRSLAPIAVAAGVLLAASATIIVRQAVMQTAAPTWLDRAQGAEVARFVEDEHLRCAALDDQTNTKFTAHTLPEAQQLIADRLGGSSMPLDLSSMGLTLTGAGGCTVPSGGESVHLLYRPQSPEAQPVSLFVQVDTTDFQGEDDECLCLNDYAEDHEVLLWRRDGLIFYLVCPRGSEADRVLNELDAPLTRTFL